MAAKGPGFRDVIDFCPTNERPIYIRSSGRRRVNCWVVFAPIPLKFGSVETFDRRADPRENLVQWLYGVPHAI